MRLKEDLGSDADREVRQPARRSWHSTSRRVVIGRIALVIAHHRRSLELEMFGLI